MAMCRICLETNENSIDIAGIEGVQLNIGKIVYQYISFCFEEEPKDGTVCRKCWLKIEMFHSFYVHIQTIHEVPTENIFVSYIDTIPKVQMSDDDIPNDVGLFGEEHESNSSNKTKNEVRDRLSVDDTEIKEERKVNRIKVLPGERKIKAKTEKKVSKTTSTKRAESKLSKRRKKGQKPAMPVAPLLKRFRTEHLHDEIQIPGSDIFPCSECDMKCLTKATLYRHVKEVHLRLEFKCNELKCVQSFATQAELDKHRIQFHTRVPCPDCGKPIASFYLNEHKKLNHDESQRVVCHLCGKVSTNMRMHKVHYQCAHMSQEKLQCDICKAWLGNKYSIRKHMSLRHIEKPIQCSLCQKLFANSNSLRSHKRLFHDDEMKQRFKCVVCGKGFRDKNNLRQHSSTHDNKVYKCPYCEKTYRNQRTHKAHIKQEHPNYFHDTSFANSNAFI